MIRVRRINNEIVRAIPPLVLDSRPIRGEELFAELTCNIFFLAKKKSGKTSAVFKVMKRCAGPNTNVIVFCGTLYKDANWKQIRNYFEKKGNPVIGYESFVENGVNHLQDLIDHMKTEAKELEKREKAGKKEKKKPIMNFHEEEDEEDGAENEGSGSERRGYKR